MNVFQRWLKFNAVGAMGVLVQLAALAALKNVFGYLTATAIAVEIAVLHNFVWHEQWTWSDRTQGHTGAAMRLIRFNLTNGLISILVNLALMRLLVGQFHIQYLIANLIAIGAGALANFLVSNWFVF